MNTKDSKPKTHFGFQQIDSEDKREKIREVFDNVVEGYDLLLNGLCAAYCRHSLTLTKEVSFQRTSMVHR